MSEFGILDVRLRRAVIESLILEVSGEAARAVVKADLLTEELPRTPEVLDPRCGFRGFHARPRAPRRVTGAWLRRFGSPGGDRFRSLRGGRLRCGERAGRGDPLFSQWIGIDLGSLSGFDSQECCQFGEVPPKVGVGSGGASRCPSHALF